MKSFFWKAVLCVVPVALAAWITFEGIVKYQNGEAKGGFKLGVDLVGGTILVYEIDTRKQLQDSQGGGRGSQDITSLLAASLKKRIDPNDLKNIVIRPAGGEGRVEIILPTGGRYQEKKADDDWGNLLKEMQAKYKLNKKPEASRGKIQELTDYIHQQLAEKKWEENLFSTEADWKGLIADVKKRWLILKSDEAKSKTLDNIPRGNVQKLVDTLEIELRDVSTEKKDIDTFIKTAAWKHMIERALTHWPQLAARKADFADIPADNFEELVGRIQTEGNVIAQAGLRACQVLVGTDAFSPAKDGKYFISRKDAEDFVKDNYGPSRSALEQVIKTAYQETGHTRDLTSEEVQGIKDLVAKVGSLEFRVLANNVDDKAAIEDARRLINDSNPAVARELKEDQDKGLPPPAPHELGLKGKLKHYTITLSHGYKCEVTYSWVELSPQERKALNLDNAASKDPERDEAWSMMAKERGRAIQLAPKRQGGTPVFQGALFYSRECTDRNLTEEDRRNKQFEYFILTRNPEIDPATGEETPRIDGSYLVRAESRPGEGARPTVSFTFNSAGGSLFGTLTRKNIPSSEGPVESQLKRHLAIILDGQMVSAPTVNSEIRESGQISGNFTQRETDNLVNILRAGQLPAALKKQPVSENSMGATLGEDTVRMGVRAILISFALILAFMIVYYRFAGLVASTALLANLILTVGVMVFVQATFTLPGLAGLVLTLALAVDANVLIYERLREERERGASLALAIRNGYDRAFPTIIDTHLSSIFTAIVLYIVGNDQLKGFGISLTLGLIISLFTSLFMTRLIFDFWLSRGWLHKLSMFKFFSKPDFDFMAIRYYWFTATILLTVAGMSLFIGRLPDDLNIDFVGGTAYGGQLVRPVSLDSRIVEGREEPGLRELLGEDRQKELLKAEAQLVPGTEGRQFKLWYLNPPNDPDGPKGNARTITLANSVDNVEEFVARASRLPDTSVEQTFRSGDQETDPNLSRYFTIRTTEKEPELVQAELDRLLRIKDKNGKWQELLKKIRLEPKEQFTKGQTDAAQSEVAQKVVHLNFSDPVTKQPTFASPSFVKTLLMREMLKEFKQTEVAKLPFIVELTGEGKTEEGRFQAIKLSFSPPLTAAQAIKVGNVLRDTARQFEDRPQPERLENFDSQLAGETRQRAMYAIIASWVAILAYLWLRFGSWTFGLATVLCLIHDLFFTLGIIAACHYLHGTWLGDMLLLEDFKIDLTSVAALLTLIGYSVSDTIVVFDRIREVRGKNPDLTPQMINDSVNQTLSRTLLTSFITWLVVFVLYVWGGPGVHLFAFVMVVGVVVGTYSSIYIASPLLLIFGEGSKATASRVQQRPVPVTV